MDKMTAMSIFNGKSLYKQLEAKHPNETQMRWADFLAEDLCISRDFLAHPRKVRAQRRIKKRISRMTSRLDSFDAVAGTVFGNYELLEMILLQLPVQDLLIVQRVDKNFRSLIQRSANIRRALYLEPSLLPQEAHIKYDFKDLRNDALIHLSEFGLDPWVLDDIFELEASEVNNGFGMQLVYRMRENYWSRRKRIEICYTHPAEASFRNMFLAAPNCNRVSISLFTRSGKVLIRTTTIENNAMTIGKVHEWLRRTYSQTVATDNFRRYCDTDQP